MLSKPTTHQNQRKLSEFNIFKSAVENSANPVNTARAVNYSIAHYEDIYWLS